MSGMMLNSDNPYVSRLVDSFTARDDKAARKAVTEILHESGGRSLSPRWHPLGFFVVHLAKDREGRRYSIHCWPEHERSTQDPAWLIHRHLWDLESMILAGELRDRQYSAAEDVGSEADGPLYIAESADARLSILRRTDRRVALDDLGAQDWRAGTWYRIAANRFHESIVDHDASCLTLVRIGERVRPNSEVLGQEDAPASLTYAARSLPLRQAGEHIGECLRRAPTGR
ncbi:hypothetical protein AB0K60_17080 [Thermopolyspora sp. NPDC052614]|uniref:hypothetical protein n=1 Tax=Thermopolyspora sp. NPDC052614 TaxID=3155682 RepID=UPI003432138E